MANTIKHQFFFPHPPKAVWEYLTNADLMELWLMKNDFQPVVGHEFSFTTKPIPSLDLDGIFRCRVLEIVPFKKLSYSWKGGSGEGKISLDTVVVWELQQTDKGTELFLAHSGFSEIENLPIYNGMNEGWLKNLHKIAERLNTTKHAASNS